MKSILVLAAAFLLLPWAALNAHSVQAQSRGNPAVYVSPDEIGAGQTISVTGVGFLPNTPLHLSASFPGAHVTNLLTAGTGAFLARYPVPASVAPGTYRMVAQISTFTPIFTTFTVASSQPYMTVSPAPVTPGEVITVTGYRFTPRAPVRVIALVGSASPTVTTTVGVNGEFTVQFGIPFNTFPGVYRISAQVSTFTPITHSFSVTGTVPSQPALFAIASDIPGGTMLTVSGHRFTPNAAVHVIVMFPHPLAKTVRVSPAGYFATNFPVQLSIQNGIYRVSAQVSTFTPITTTAVISR